MKILLEHSLTPGSFYENHLIYGDTGCVLNEMDLHEAEDKSGNKLMKFKGKLQEANRPNKNMRMYTYEILESNRKKLEDTLANGGLIGECLVDSNFEILTPQGWKHFNQIRVGDEVFSRVNGEMVCSKVDAIINEPYDGKSYHVKGRSIDCSFTATHKFLICDRNNKESYTTIDNIHNDRVSFSHYYIPKTSNWSGKETDIFVIPGVLRQKTSYASKELVLKTKNFCEFLGLYLSEGCLKVGNNSNRIEISQSTTYGKKIVKETLDRLSEEIKWKEFNGGFYTTDARLYDYLKPLGNKYNKYIPEEIKALDGKYLEVLLGAFAVGDGRMLTRLPSTKKCTNYKLSENFNMSLDIGVNSRISAFSVSKNLIDDLHECLVKTGRSGTITTIIDKEDYVFAGRTIKVKNKRPLYNLHFSRTKGIHLDSRFLKTIEGHHTGRMYCIKTTHGSFYMRYRGKAFWTGNCDHPNDSVIHFANASHKLINLWWDNDVLMGEGYILNTPHGKILKTLINDGCRIGMSSRGVGNGKVNTEGILVIGESYKLITFDAVADPSTFAAFQEKIKSNESTNIKQNVQNVVKNENNSIDKKYNKELILACLGGLIKEQTQELKARLN